MKLACSGKRSRACTESGRRDRRTVSPTRVAPLLLPPAKNCSSTQLIVHRTGAEPNQCAVCGGPVQRMTP
jgi:hypothetical protein